MMHVTIGSLLELSPERREQEYYNLAKSAVEKFKTQPEHTNHSAILALMGGYKIKLSAYDISKIEAIADTLQ